MLDNKKEFICKIKEIVKKHQHYDMNEFFNCKFDVFFNRNVYSVTSPANVKCNMIYFKSFQIVENLTK